MLAWAHIPALRAARTGATPYNASPAMVSLRLALLGRAGYLTMQHHTQDITQDIRYTLQYVTTTAVGSEDLM